MIDFNSLSEDEQKAVKALRRIAKKWPKTLWLWSRGGNIWVMKNDDNGSHSKTADGYDGVNVECVVSLIDIPNDGGDW